MASAFESLDQPSAIIVTIASDAPAPAPAPAKRYGTYIIRSWHQYQSFTPSHLHSIPHYNKSSEEDAKLFGEDVMVLRDEVTKITGYYWYSNGFPAQNCAETDGYVDVRTGKRYERNGCSYFKDIG
jgi:hypothetical protein